MKLIVTGVNSDGRSYAVEVLDVASPVPGSLSGYAHVALERLMTSESPAPAPPQGHGYKLDLGIAPGLLKLFVLDFAPNADGTSDHFHNTDAIELDLVIENNCEILLGDGTSHELSVGDGVLLMGNDHARRAGPNGCRMVTIAIGTQPQQAFPVVTRSVPY